MSHSPEILFDLEALINEAQPTSILWLGEAQPKLLENYLAQCDLLGIDVAITFVAQDEIDSLYEMQQRFDLGIAFSVIDELDKTQAVRLISRLRDVLCQQFCINLCTTELSASSPWQLTDMIGLGMRKVADYSPISTSLYKYSIDSYKRTPDWLNADNWANPELWGKYRW